MIKCLMTNGKCGVANEGNFCKYKTHCNFTVKDDRILMGCIIIRFRRMIFALCILFPLWLLRCWSNCGNHSSCSNQNELVRTCKQLINEAKFSSCSNLNELVWIGRQLMNEASYFYLVN